MDVMELTKRAVELASKDEELREKTKDMVATIVMVLKDGEDTIMISIDRGELRFSPGGRGNRFPARGVKGELHGAHDWEGYPLIMFATKKLKPLAFIPKLGKEIAEKEGL